MKTLPMLSEMASDTDTQRSKFALSVVLVLLHLVQETRKFLNFLNARRISLFHQIRTRCPYIWKRTFKKVDTFPVFCSCVPDSLIERLLIHSNSSCSQVFQKIYGIEWYIFHFECLCATYYFVNFELNDRFVVVRFCGVLAQMRRALSHVRPATTGNELSYYKPRQPSRI